MIIGIDLGTTTSLAAIWRDGEHQLLPNPLGHVLTPSAVALDDHGKLLVGIAARDRLAIHPDQGAVAFKRAMGTNKEFALGSRRLRAEELSALVLGALKADAEQALGEKITEAVITVPAYFNELQRQATKLAGEMAGLKVERLLNEPTAAALAYGLLGRDEDGTIIVVDLGGGTFDVSVLDRFSGVMEVRATAGDIFLGGEDFADVIAEAFIAEAPGAAILRAPDQQMARGLLRHQAELAKRQLSQSETALLTVPVKGQDLQWRLSRERFEALAEPLLQRIRTPIERALRDAKLRAAEIEHVVLAGGASRMPMFRRMIGRLFKRLPVQHLNPDEVVARGAAVQAGLKMRDQALDEIVLTDVAPFTLGIDVAEADGQGNLLIGGLMAPIIERSTVIPASRSKIFSTLRDQQTIIRMGIYQGEARQVSENLALGTLSITVPPRPAGMEKVEVRFTYDNNGLLEVEAKLLSSGTIERLVIDGRKIDLDPTEIAARLAALAHLKQHPREDAENRAVLARADRLYQQCLGSEREQLGRAITAFSVVLEGQDPRAIDVTRQALATLLEGIERGTFL